MLPVWSISLTLGNITNSAWLRGIIFFTLVGIIAILITGCASPGVQVSFSEPPNFPAAASLKRVAVLRFDGSNGDQVMLEFESLLAQANVNGQAYFNLLDRRTLNNAIHELKLHQTGLIDPTSVARLGRFVGVDGIYTGSVIMPPIQRQSYTEARSECTSVKNSKKLVSKCTSVSHYTVSCIRRVAEFTLVPRLIKVETAQVIYQPTVTATREASSCSDAGSAGVGDGEMLAEARQEVFQKILADIAPHVVNNFLKLKEATEGLSKGTQEKFNSGLAFAKGGRMDRACEIWREIESAEATNFALAYDLAVCTEISGNLQGALEAYTMLDRRLTAPDKDLDEAMKRVRARIEVRMRSSTTTPSSDRAPQATVTRGRKERIN